MRIIKEKFPEEKDFIPEEEGFLPIKEPSQDKMLKIISILAFILMLISLGIYVLIYGFSEKMLIIVCIISFFLIVPHELVHAIFFPGSIFSDKVVIGSYIKGGVFYAHYSGEMPKRKFLIVLLAPFTIFTVIPIIICLFAPHIEILILLAIINGVSSIGDLIGAFILLKNAPKGSIIRNKGYKTYYKIT